MKAHLQKLKITDKVLTKNSIHLENVQMELTPYVEAVIRKMKDWRLLFFTELLEAFSCGW